MPAEPLSSSDGRLTWWTGPLLATITSLILLGHWGLEGKLARDASVYAYAGEQLLRGVPPYVSIFDPKGPLPAFLAGLGAWLGDLTGHRELTGIRIVYGLTTCAASGGLFLLARRMLVGFLPAVTAAVTLCALPAVAANAFSGPEAKAPVLLFLVLALYFATCGRWVLSGASIGLASLAWQPTVVVAAVLFLAAVSARPEAGMGRAGRTRAVGYVAGVAAPVTAWLVYLVVSHSLRAAFEASVLFPLTGIRHGPSGVDDRLDAIGAALVDGHWLRGALAVVGIVALYAVVLRHSRASHTSWWSALRDPVVITILGPATVLLAFCATDFQGPPDLLPLSPFAALGVGGLVDSLRSSGASARLRQLSALALPAVVAIAWLVPSGYQGGLPCQAAHARWLDSLAPDDGELWAFGDPSVLVLTERRNPDRFVYLAGGFATWKVEHQEGGLESWKSQILGASPDVAVFGGFNQGPISRELKELFADQDYSRARLGTWTVYVTPGAPSSDTDLDRCEW